MGYPHHACVISSQFDSSIALQDPLSPPFLWTREPTTYGCGRFRYSLPRDRPGGFDVGFQCGKATRSDRWIIASTWNSASCGFRARPCRGPSPHYAYIHEFLHKVFGDNLHNIERISVCFVTQNTGKPMPNLHQRCNSIGMNIQELKIAPKCALGKPGLWHCQMPPDPRELTRSRCPLTRSRHPSRAKGEGQGF